MSCRPKIAMPRVTLLPDRAVDLAAEVLRPLLPVMSETRIPVESPARTPAPPRERERLVRAGRSELEAAGPRIGGVYPERPARRDVEVGGPQLEVLAVAQVASNVNMALAAVDESLPC